MRSCPRDRAPRTWRWRGCTSTCSTCCARRRRATSRRRSPRCSRTSSTVSACAMCKSAAERGAGRAALRAPQRAVAALLLVALLAATPFAAHAQSTGQPSALELSRGVSQSLLHLQEVWLQWISAFYQGDRNAAGEHIKELRSALQRLGFRRLPELSIAATVRAIEAARQGDLQRA